MNNALQIELCKKILKTMTWKKDNVKVWWDLKWRGIKLHLWLTPNPREGRKMLKLMAPYVLTTSEFDYFVTTIENLKTSLEHVLVMGKYIRKKNFGGLESHDYHILMQFYLLVLRPRMVVMKFFKVFKRVCNKIWDPSDLNHPKTMLQSTYLWWRCIYCPLSLMLWSPHLLYHLVEEVDLCGLIANRWMYPMEGYMKTLKNYMHNLAWLEIPWLI
jgi:hypothetical protein